MRNKKLLLIGIVIMGIFFISSNTSSINILWIKCYGGYLEEDPVGMIKMLNGDVIIGSNSRSFDGDVGKIYGKKYEDQNIFIYRINKNGNIIWKRIIGGTNGNYGEFVNNIVQMDGGKFLIYGITNSNDYDMKGSGLSNDSKTSIPFIFILNENGEILYKMFCTDLFKNGINQIEKFNKGYLIYFFEDNKKIKLGYYLFDNGFQMIWNFEIKGWDHLYVNNDSFFISDLNGQKIDQYDKNGNLLRTINIDNSKYKIHKFYKFAYWNNFFVFIFNNIVRIADTNGNIILEKKIEPKSPYNENYFSDFISYSKDKFILVSNNYVIIDKDKQDEFQTDICIMLMDQKGNILEEKYIKGNWVDSTKYLYPLSDHEFILLGQTNSTGGDIQGAHVDYNISELGNDKDILVVKFSIE